MAAALGPHLILEHQCRHAGFLEGAYHEMHIHRVTVASVGIGAQQQFVAAIGEIARVVKIDFKGHHAAVGPTQPTLRHARARNGAHLETCRLHQPRAVTIKHPGRNDNPRLFQQLPELFSLACHDLFSCSGWWSFYQQAPM